MVQNQADSTKLSTAAIDYLYEIAEINDRHEWMDEFDIGSDKFVAKLIVRESKGAFPGQVL